MNYRSPVRLVAHSGESITDVNPNTFSRARRKLLAELSLGNNELTIDGIAYGRNDITNLLDSADIEKHWPTHCYIYASPALLALLETDHFDVKGFSEQVRSGEAPDPAFLSKYFAPAFNEATRPFINNKNYWMLAELQTYQYLILPEDSHEAYGRIRVHLDELLYTIRNMYWEKLVMDKTQLNFISAPRFAQFLNGLPSYMGEWRDRFVANTISLVVRLQKKATWKALHTVCQHLQQIECSATMKAEVDRFEDAMADNIRYDKGKSGPSIPRVIYPILVVVFAILRFAMISNRVSSNNAWQNIQWQNATVSPSSWVTSTTETQSALTHLFDSLDGRENKGKRLVMANGAAPFSGISHAPGDSAAINVRVNNNTKSDLVMMCLPNHVSSWDTVLQFEALYIRQGDHVNFTFTPSFTRIYFMQGHDWVKLAHPAKLATAGHARVKEYFRTAPKDQPFLYSYLVLLDNSLKSNDAWNESDAQLLYRPVDGTYKYGSKTELTMVEKEGKLSVQGSGDLFIYRKFENLSLD